MHAARQFEGTQAGHAYNDNMKTATELGSKSSPGESALNILHSNLDSLDTAINRLRNRLHLAIRPLPESAGTLAGAAPTPVRAPIVSGIEHAADVVQTRINQIDALIESIGL